MNRLIDTYINDNRLIK